MAQIRGFFNGDGSTDWQPLACTKMPDGTYVLKVDSELTVPAVMSISRGNPVHYNGNANIAAAPIIFTAAAKHIQIENMTTLVSNLYISFDAGVNWRTVRPGEVIDIDCDAVAGIDIKSDLNLTAYEILTVE